jgi:purine catabolism regulator
MRLTVDRVLGPILTYDDEHGTNLYLTLTIFLTLDRNYKLAASHLGIHRQTLVYRLKRVEELTAHSLASTRDLCELWLAVRARAALAVVEDLPQLRS